MHPAYICLQLNIFALVNMKNEVDRQREALKSLVCLIISFADVSR